MTLEWREFDLGGCIETAVGVQDSKTRTYLNEHTMRRRQRNGHLRLRPWLRLK